MSNPDLKDALASLKIDRASESAPEGRGRLWLWIALAALLLVAAGAWLLRPRAVEVRSVVVEETGGAVGGGAVLNASGYVTARREATVSSKVTGKVVEVMVEEGMKVEAGQVLARLDDSQARLAYELAQAEVAAADKAQAETEAQLHEARLRRDRTKNLAAQGISSQADVDAVEAEAESLAARLASQSQQVEVARRALAVDRQNLEDMVIRAPFAGVAISKNAQPGEMISPISAGGGFTRTGISTVVDMTSLEIEVDVNEAYIQRVSSGQKALATLDAYPEAPIPAHVITTIPAAEREKATVKVRIGFDQLDPRILPDMGVKVAFLGDAAAGGGQAKPAVRVPRSALRGALGAQFVWIVRGDRLERRAIRLGPGDSDPAEVVAGLGAGERVVIEGPETLTAESRVVERKTN
jgi:RND family efflux transporter MFP subunit